jgi:PAS domain S-box-containing protein
VWAWLLPASDDDAPDMELGPPPLDLAYGIRAYTIVRLAAALMAVFVHVAMGLATGWTTWWVISGLSLVHILIMVPFGSSAARDRPILTLIADGGAMFVATMIVGDPVVLSFWAPMLLMSTLVYLGARVGQLGVAITLTMVLAAFAARWTGLIDNQLDDGEVRLYAVLSTSAIGLVAWLYLYAVGGAVNRKDRALARAEAETLAARRRADMRAAQLEAVFEHAPIGLSLQEGSQFLYVNPVAQEILGLSREHIMAFGATDSLPADVRHMVEAQIDDCRRTLEPFRIEYPIVTPKGEEKWISHAGHAIELDTGMGFVSTLEDLTTARLAATRSRRFSAALETTDDLVVIWDDQGTILHANRAFQRFWETTGDPAGRPLEEVVGVENAFNWTGHGDGDAPGAREVEVKCPSGDVLAMSLLVLRSEVDEEEPSGVYTAAIRDIGEVVEARRQLEGLLRSKDQFIASVSHELRTPLAAVLGLAGELSAGFESFGRDEVVELTGIIAEQSADLSALVEDLLTAARADAGVLTITVQAVDLSQVVLEALASSPPDLRNSVAVHLVPDLVVDVDPTRTRQIVRNLLTNARRYGGPRVELAVSRAGDHATVEVRDNGRPIPEEARERMFQAYGRAHERVGTPDSVGLGLTVSQRLARMMGGDVAYHHDGEWSTFVVTFPISSQRDT